MMFWSVGPFWYMVYGLWYVVYGMKMAFTVYLHTFCVHRIRAVYNKVHLFLVIYKIQIYLQNPYEFAFHLIYIILLPIFQYQFYHFDLSCLEFLMDMTHN